MANRYTRAVTWHEMRKRREIIMQRCSCAVTFVVILTAVIAVARW